MRMQGRILSFFCHDKLPKCRGQSAFIDLRQLIRCRRVLSQDPFTAQADGSQTVGSDQHRRLFVQRTQTADGQNVLFQFRVIDTNL